MPFYRICYKQEIEYEYDLVAIDTEDASRIADNMGSFIMPTNQDVVLKGKATEVAGVTEISYDQFKETQVNGYPPCRKRGMGSAELPSLEFLVIRSNDVDEHNCTSVVLQP